MQKIRILDERNISFDIIEGTLEVYDQKNNLVGEAEMNVEINSTMTMEEVNQVATDAGYDLWATITAILTAAVMTEQNYDIWLTEESVIMFSPSANQFVSEPYEGVFLKLLDYYDANVGLEEVEAVEEENNTYQEATFEEITQDSAVEVVEEVANSNSEEIQDGFIPPNETLILVVEEEDEEISSQSAEEFVVEVEQPVAQRVVQQVVEPVIEEVQEQQAEPVAQPIQEEESKVVVMLPLIEEDNRLNDWKEAYKQSMISNTEQNGVKLSQLRDKVVEIVLAKGNALEVSESEVLFELLEQTEFVFDAKIALHAGLYQAYEFQKIFA